MADTIEQQDIRGLDIDKAVKGFALVNYIFKNDCTVSSTTGDSIRWYQETATDLTATSPSAVANISPLATFTTLEPSWTRNTSYVRKYAAESFLSMEDMKSADIDVLARTLLRLTRAVVKQVDSRIYDVMTESGSPSNINTFAASNKWSSGAVMDPIDDLLTAKREIYQQDYDPEGATLYLNPEEYKMMVTWLIGTKGSSIPNFSSEKVRTGIVGNLCGLNIKVSNNVDVSAAAVVIPKTACTWKTHTATTARVIEDPGLGSKIRVWEIGEAILTDPKAVCYISALS